MTANCWSSTHLSASRPEYALTSPQSTPASAASRATRFRGWSSTTRMLMGRGMDILKGSVCRGIAARVGPGRRILSIRPPPAAAFRQATRAPAPGARSPGAYRPPGPRRRGSTPGRGRTSACPWRRPAPGDPAGCRAPRPACRPAASAPTTPAARNRLAYSGIRSTPTAASSTQTPSPGHTPARCRHFRRGPAAAARPGPAARTLTGARRRTPPGWRARRPSAVRRSPGPGSPPSPQPARTWTSAPRRAADRRAPAPGGTARGEPCAA